MAHIEGAVWDGLLYDFRVKSELIALPWVDVLFHKVILQVLDEDEPFFLVYQDSMNCISKYLIIFVCNLFSCIIYAFNNCISAVLARHCVYSCKYFCIQIYFI